MNFQDMLTEKRLRDLDEMVAEISAEELKAKLEAGEIFQLIDVSEPEAFQKGHLPTAENLPLTELGQVAPARFRPFQQLVVYCAEADSSLAQVAARLLQDLGFYNVLVLKGGKEAWRQAGYELVSDAEPTGAGSDD